MHLRHLAALPVLVLTLFATALPASAAVWRVTGGTATLSLADGHLSNLGFTIVNSNQTSVPHEEQERSVEPPYYSFAVETTTDVEFRTENGRIVELLGGALPFRGGLAIRTEHPRTRAALTPAFLYDFRLELLDEDAWPAFARLRVSDPSVDSPLAVQSSGLSFDAAAGQGRIIMGDLVVTEEWAKELGQLELKGQWVGVFDVRFTAEPVSGAFEERPTPPGAPERQRALVDTLDVVLGELYGITSHAHEGTYPDGRAGLTAATTSCNNGNVPVPWFAPMSENHPFIGLGLFREKDGILEMIGKNWMKHAWFALSNDQCFYGCDSGTGGGTTLAIGCSDTYSAGNNASGFYLGPREEINPHTGTWSCTGSYFDGTPVDCVRDESGPPFGTVPHRLEVADADLGNLNADSSAAKYYYEGFYVVADDDDITNNIGWRECSMSWTGSNWSFSTVGGGLTPTHDALIQTWGDQVQTAIVAPDDGVAMLAVKVDDLGGGTWHYEYALYNRTSHRAIRSFSVPVGIATISNIGFHDLDQDGGNDWSVDTSGGAVTWSTDDHATDPDAPALTYGTMFNFRFDADAPSVTMAATGELFLPGLGTSFIVDTLVPDAPTGVAAGGVVAETLSFEGVEPNPFTSSTRVSFTVPSPRRVRLSVIDVTGRAIQTLVDGDAAAGVNTVRWNGRDATGSRVASGIYFFRLESGDEVRTIKGALLR